MSTATKLEVTTLANMVAQDDNAKAEFWSNHLDLSSQTKDIFSALEGDDGSRKPFYVRQDLSKGRGDTLHFHVMEGLGGPAILGSNSAEGQEEALTLGGYDVRVEIVRKVIGLQFAAMEFTDVGSELDNKCREALGEWMGRYKQTAMMIKLIRSAVDRNTIRPNSKQSDSALTLSDTLSTTTIEDAAELAQINGAIPANLGISTLGNEIHQFLVVATKTGLRAVKVENAYLQGLREAGLRGGSNPLFAGGYADWSGHGIFEFSPVDVAGASPVGCPMLPKAYLGVALTAADTAQDIYGGGNSTNAARTPAPQYFESFSNYDFLYYADQSPETFTTDRYAVVYNLSGTNAGKWGFYKYVTNSGNKLTMAARLRASAGGIAVSTLGGVTWNASKHTDAHPEGSLIIETNENAVPVGSTFLFGAMAAVRAYGRVKNQRITSTHQNYGDDRGIGVKSIFGQAPCVRTDGVGANYVLIRHAVTHRGINLSLT
ncbi:MAG: DUF4043 family protein [Verrucomicrobiota bacterium]